MQLTNQYALFKATYKPKRLESYPLNEHYVLTPGAFI